MKIFLCSHSFTRTWMTLGPLYTLSRILSFITFDSSQGLIWGIPQIPVFWTWVLVTLLVTGVVLVWSRWEIVGSLGIAILLFTHSRINPFFYWSWVSVFPALIFARECSLKLTSPSLKKFFHLFFVFSVVTIYFIPTLDRMIFNDWFNGRIVAVYLGMPYFARWPVIIPEAYYHWLAPFSLLAFFIEGILPLLFLFHFLNRKIIAKIMIVFHFLLMLISDVEIWHPLMIFLWLDLASEDVPVSSRVRLIFAVMLISLTPLSLIFGGETIQVIHKNPLYQFLDKSGILNVSKMRMFSAPDKIPISSKILYQHQGNSYEVRPGLQNYFYRMFFSRNEIPLDVLCRNKNDGPIKIDFMIQNLNEQKRTFTRQTDCR